MCGVYILASFFQWTLTQKALCLRIMYIYSNVEHFPLEAAVILLKFPQYGHIHIFPQLQKTDFNFAKHIISTNTHPTSYPNILHSHPLRNSIVNHQFHELRANNHIFCQYFCKHGKTNFNLFLLLLISKGNVKWYVIKKMN